jgi:hypothetical protein
LNQRISLKYDDKTQQDKYGAAMKRYNLERGEINSKAHHIDTQEYYRHINAAAKASEAISSELSPVVEFPPLLVGREAYQQQLQAQIFDYYAKIEQKLREKAFEVARLEKENKALKSQILGRESQKQSLPIASQFNSQRAIRQRPQQQQRGEGKGMSL